MSAVAARRFIERSCLRLILVFWGASTLATVALTLAIYHYQAPTADGLHILPLGALLIAVAEVFAYRLARLEGEFFRPQLSACFVAIFAGTQSAAASLLAANLTGGIGAGWLSGESLPGGLIASFAGFLFAYGALQIFFKVKSREMAMVSLREHCARNAY